MVEQQDMVTSCKDVHLTLQEPLTDVPFSLSDDDAGDDLGDL